MNRTFQGERKRTAKSVRPILLHPDNSVQCNVLVLRSRFRPGYLFLAICRRRSCFWHSMISPFVLCRNREIYPLALSLLLNSQGAGQLPSVICQNRMNQVPKNVIDRDMAFLYAMNAVAWHDQAVINCAALL